MTAGDVVASARSLAQVACRLVGVSGGVLEPVRVHSNAVFAAVEAGIVVRVGGGADAVDRARRAVMVCRWLAQRGFPAVVPAGVEQPVVLVDAGGEVAVTFWDWVPAGGGPATGVQLGRLLRGLHDLPPPPFDLPVFQPLRRLVAAVRGSSWLSEDDREWLLGRAGALQRHLDAAAGSGAFGLVHGDAQLGNVIPGMAGGVLCDWDSVVHGPRVWDLISGAVEYRFGGSPSVLGEVLGAYGGGDLVRSAVWPVLRDVWELRSVAAHIRRAPDSSPHAAEARLRIASLRGGDRTARWHAVG